MTEKEIRNSTADIEVGATPGTPSPGLASLPGEVLSFVSISREEKWVPHGIAGSIAPTLYRFTQMPTNVGEVKSTGRGVIYHALALRVPSRSLALQ